MFYRLETSAQVEVLFFNITQVCLRIFMIRFQLKSS